jgi:hypothetical protein
MKFYNPFKPHIVEYDGWYYVRRLTLIGYTCMDRNSFYWWYARGFWEKYCKTSLDQAKEMLNQTQNPIKTKVIFP